MRITLAFTVSLLFVIACGGKNSETPAAKTIDEVKTYEPIDILGAQRNYHLFLPQEPTTARILFLLHGNRGSSDQLLGFDGTTAPYKFWLDIAKRENLILVAPNGAVGSEGHQGWNDCRTDAPTNPTTDDVLFINTLIDTVTTKYQTNDKKIFIVGTSNGGLMSNRLADEMPERIHAIAAVVASRPINSECTSSSEPISALIMNGTADPILPYDGGHIRPMRGELLSTADAVAYWVNRNQAKTAIDQVQLADIDKNDNSVVKVTHYLDGLNNTQVKLYEIEGGGHTEPSIGERFARVWKLVVGEQNNDIEMADEIWAFFESLDIPNI